MNDLASQRETLRLRFSSWALVVIGATGAEERGANVRCDADGRLGRQRDKGASDIGV